MIDEKKLIEVLKKHFDADYGEDGRLLYSDHVCTSDDVDDIIKLVEEQPKVDGKDTNVPSKWIPCSEDNMPEELVPVNITWTNREPSFYYRDIKDKPFTATAVYCNEKWFWWSSICEDVLAEYGRNDAEIVAEIDEDVEILAWMPLPEPYKEGENGDN